MKFFKTLRTRQPSFSTDKSVDLYAPKSWRELTQEQLHYVFTLMATFADLTVVKTYMFVRFVDCMWLKRTVSGGYAMCAQANLD